MEKPQADADSNGMTEDRLINLGHTPELKRTYGFWSCKTLYPSPNNLLTYFTVMAYQTTILSSWSGNIVMYYYIFTLGGPVCLLWGT